MVDLTRTTNQNIHFHDLVMLLDAELCQRNGDEQSQFNSFNIIGDSDSVVIAYKEGMPVGCGCFKRFNKQTIEVKRMYVHLPNRGLGIGGLILKEIESWAIEKGFIYAVLETGTRLPEAVHLYKKMGFNETNKWGPYINVENSICLRKMMSSNSIISIVKKVDKIVHDFELKCLRATLDWDFKPNNDKWSPKEILGHLIDSANNNIQRFVKGTYEQEFKLVYNQNEWVKNQHYNQSNEKDLIQLWKLLNKQIIRILENYPLTRLSVKVDTAQSGTDFKEIRDIAVDYAEHLQHHMNQILNLIQPMKLPILPDIEHYKWGDNCDGWHLLKSDSLSVIREIMPQGTLENPHYHSKSQQLFFILSGEASFEMGEEEFSLKAKESIHVPSGTVHSIANCGYVDLEFLVISEPKSHGDRQNVSQL